jgi:hypothetical protein
MAQQTSQIASFADGLVRAEIDWNDANGQITRGRVINNSAFPAHMEALLNPPVNGWSAVELPAPANVTTGQNFPNNTVKMTLVTEDGVTEWKLIGVTLHLRNA